MGHQIRRRQVLKGIGATVAFPLAGASPVAAETDAVRTFDVSKLPQSIGFLSDPKGRQREAWEIAVDLTELEQDASDKLGQYSSDELAAVFSETSDARTDLRSLSRLVEVLHENDLAAIIDESLLNSIGKRADLALRYAPMIGGVNNVLDKAERFANAVEGDRRPEYVDFVLSIACFCLEMGLIWVGAPYKLAWKGTQKLFFARNGTLFRLGRYGGDRFVAFFMSEVHWELREALFDEINVEKAEWVASEVNDHRDVPKFTDVRNDVESFVQDRPEFSVEDLQEYEFAKDYAKEAADAGSAIVGEVIETLPSDWGSNSETESESLVLKSTMDWEKQIDSEKRQSSFGF